MSRTRESGASQGRAEGNGGSAAPSVEQALVRARLHARAAAAEALEAVRALLDAATLAMPGAPSGAQRLLALASNALEGLTATLGVEGAAAQMQLGRALAEALDAEIARWEGRARDDTEARAVLRAFLGLRELLWEFGVRPESTGRATRATRARRKVERVPVQG